MCCGDGLLTVVENGCTKVEGVLGREVMTASRRIGARVFQAVGIDGEG
jgi:hypothetical protein